jgi:hypothetical protein
VYALSGCQKGKLSATDNLIDSYLCIHWFFEKVKSQFPKVFLHTSCTLQHALESTKYNWKFIVHLKVHKCTFGCTVYPFSISCRKILIPMCQCTFGCTLYFQKWKYKVHLKVQITSKSTKYTTFNLFLRIRLKQKWKFIQLGTIILTSAKISSGRVGPPSKLSKSLLLTHFLYEC